MYFGIVNIRLLRGHSVIVQAEYFKQSIQPPLFSSMRILFRILLLFCLCGFLSQRLLAQQYDFRTWSVTEGLPKAGVYDILQDSRGYLWFATEGGGASQFDGHSFRNWNSSHGLVNDVVRCMEEDHLGRLWFGTEGGGISRFDGQNWFTLNEGLENRNIRALAWDSASSTLWIGTLGGGLYSWRSSEEGATLRSYAGNSGLPSDRIRALLIDHSGRLWIGTDKGPAWKTEEGFRALGISDGLLPRKVLCFYQDSRERVWIGTEKGALRYEDESFYLWTRADGLVHPRVRSISEDREGNLWFGTREGASRCSETFSGTLWETFTTRNGLSFDRIRSIHLDGQGNLWFGTFFGGVSRFTDRAFSYHNESSGLRGTIVQALASRPAGDGEYVAVGTWEGLTRFGEYDQVVHYDTLETLLSSLVTALVYDRRGRLWVGYDEPGVTWIREPFWDHIRRRDGLPKSPTRQLAVDSKNRIWILQKSGKVRVIARDYVMTPRYFPVLNELEGYSFSRMCADPEGERIWFLTGDGQLLLYQNERVRRLENVPFAEVRSMQVDREGWLWIAGDRSSLARLSGEVWTKLGPSKTGVQGDIGNIAFDGDQNLWISLDQGVLKFDLDEQGIPTGNGRLYDSDQGFRGTYVVPGATFTTEDGRIFFGTLDGVVQYEPGEDRVITSQPGIQLTGLDLEGQTTDWKARGNEVESWTGMPQSLTLPYRFNQLTFHYTGIDFESPEQLSYRYRLSGLNQDWVNAEDQRAVNYSGIEAGTHLFEVTASRDSIVAQGDIVSYSFRIRPPFWQTPWFFALAILGVLGLIAGYNGIRSAALRREKRKLEDANEQLEATVAERTREYLEAKEAAEASEKVKEQFLANMSHEIRTPMNAIVGMTNILIKEDPEAAQMRYLDAIRQSSDNLLVIINDILDISKIEAGKMEFESINFSIDRVLHGVKDTLVFKAEEKGLELNIDKDEKVPEWAVGDPVRLTQILINLVGNAIKFTESGSVTVKVACPVKDASKAKIRFSVIDTGIGIPADRVDNIFETFSQAGADTTRKFGGTGLGLSISKQLVEQQGGGIDLESELGKGSNFFFHLFFPHGEAPAEDSQDSGNGQHAEILKGARVLLAEDNDFNVMVAVDTLKDLIEGIDITVAPDGVRAVKELEGSAFDIVLMDIQMPEMDGYTATKTIRDSSDKRVRATPIMAMTAAVTKAEVDKCFEAGMDNYIAKPFDSDELLEKMAGLRNMKRVSDAKTKGPEHGPEPADEACGKED